MEAKDLSVQEMIAKVQGYLRNQPVERAWLFGSYSRGEQKKTSDVDILAVLTEDISLLHHARIMVELEELLGKRVDFVIEGTLYPFAEASANRDKILIYERPAA